MQGKKLGSGSVNLGGGSSGGINLGNGSGAVDIKPQPQNGSGAVVIKPQPQTGSGAVVVKPSNGSGSAQIGSGSGSAQIGNGSGGISLPTDTNQQSSGGVFTRSKQSVQAFFAQYGVRLP